MFDFMTDVCDSWQKYQLEVKNNYNYWSSICTQKRNYSYYELISNSVPDDDSLFEISVSEDTYDVDITFILSSIRGQSILWFSEAMNEASTFSLFLEAIILSKNNEIFFRCDEEGRLSFFIVKKLDAGKIRFIQLQQTKFDGDKIQHDLIIDFKDFVKKFNIAIKQVLDNTTEEECSQNGSIDTFKKLQAGYFKIEELLQQI